LANKYILDFDPLIFTVNATAEGIVNWKIITEALHKQYDLHAPYVRFGKL